MSAPSSHRRPRVLKWTAIESVTMNIYNLGDVQATTDGPDTYYGFDIIDVLDQPLITIAFETRREAEAVHIAMQPIIALAKVIKGFPSSSP
jgi:hypothetical protein